jgi:hypothetical protein
MNRKTVFPPLIHAIGKVRGRKVGWSWYFGNEVKKKLKRKVG